MLNRATTLAAAQAGTGEIRAGGTDVQERLRHHISHAPIVDISAIDGLRAIARQADDTVSIGALVSIDAVAKHPELAANYPALSLAAGALATPQIRSMASMGGALLQRTRCWYYRHPDLTCYKNGGDACLARDGDHRFGVCFDLGPCAFPHPSTLGMALLTYDAEVTINGQERRPLSAVFGDGSDPHRDHTLEPGAVLTSIELPAPLADERGGYFRAITRARAEWPLVEVSVRLAVDADAVITFARIGLGGVANIPLRLPAVEQALLGQPATPATFTQAGQQATHGATPLPMTGYKVDLIASSVAETLQRAYQRSAQGEG